MLDCLAEDPWNCILAQKSLVEEIGVLVVMLVKEMPLDIVKSCRRNLKCML